MKGLFDPLHSLLCILNPLTFLLILHNLDVFLSQI